jgi:CheY-like chemotaxis protein
VSKTILIVDDDDALREALAEMLALEGFRIECSPHGAEAIAKLNAGLRPHLILLDLMMPVMDGWEFREAQLARAELADIPVVVITAAGVLKKPIDARHILRKPFRIEELVRVVTAA